MSEFENGEPLDPAQELEARLLKRNEVMHAATKPGNSDVQKFYKEATVFVTGGSGFLGKQLIEKLLRATNVSKIFVLMRSKKGKSITKRLNDILENPVYDLVREQQPGFKQKIVLVEGDVSEIRLGLSDENWKILISQTEVIFHLAAITRFDETLRNAILSIARGTRETLKLGKECSKLKSFVYVSTAYSQAISSRIKGEVLEDFYPSPIDPEAMIRMVETLEDQKLIDITDSLIKGWPNTYSFSKAIAEDMVREAGELMPVCVVRPGIIIGAIREPEPGWVDISSIYGASGVAMAIGMGIMHVIYGDGDTRFGLIPTDYVNNAVITAGYETAKRRVKGDRKPKVYTVVSSTRTDVNFGDLLGLSKNSIECCTPQLIWDNFYTQTPNRILFWILTWILHYIPAYTIDGVCWILGKERKFVKLYQKMYNQSMALGYFNVNDWEFEDKNLAALYESLSPIDKEIFNFDVETINWKEYIIAFGVGLRKYIVKDGLKGSVYAKRKRFYFKCLNYVLLPLYLFALYKIISFGVCLLVKLFM